MQSGANAQGACDIDTCNLSTVCDAQVALALGVVNRYTQSNCRHQRPHTTFKTTNGVLMLLPLNDDDAAAAAAGQ